MLDTKLYTLLTVVEKKSFTKAAKELCLTQPAVSTHINQLESEFGVKIFTRSKEEIKETPEGAIIIQYARRMKAIYDKLKLDLNDFSKKITKLRVGITHTSESNNIAEVLAKYGSLNNGVSIIITTDTIKNLYEMLLNYELDLAIVEGKLLSPSLNNVMIDTDHLVCVVSKKNSLAKKAMVTLCDLRKEKMILRLPKSGTVNLFVSQLTSIGMSISDLNVILEVDNIATIKDLVSKDFGISILPKSVCMDEVKTGSIAVLPIQNMNMIRETNIVYPKDFGFHEIIDEIVKLYKIEKH